MTGGAERAKICEMRLRRLTPTQWLLLGCGISWFVLFVMSLTLMIWAATHFGHCGGKVPVPIPQSACGAVPTYTDLWDARRRPPRARSGSADSSGNPTCHAMGRQA
jgi:hypothetical protein